MRPFSKALVGTNLSENKADIKEVCEWHLGIDKKVLHWESYVKAGYYVRTRVGHGTPKSWTQHEACVGSPQ
jgi:hypothetical protein